MLKQHRGGTAVIVCPINAFTSMVTKCKNMYSTLRMVFSCTKYKEEEEEEEAEIFKVPVEPEVFLFLTRLGLWPRGAE